jgi:hypothetical protein
MPSSISAKTMFASDRYAFCVAAALSLPPKWQNDGREEGENGVVNGNGGVIAFGSRICLL